ncbi:FtsK/SpoIIIE domain-containing protein [Actinokineospora enzanensis]|uniref:FtsK/SpoIIIE domain-containing protein n=1 Tax=Actinokineospora enzanensis TaxID=155975 RepID=UPI000476C716|nr:FtsK/SpoIIIE domain-containing protein [Actinokineospora enzanensis]
MGKRERRERAEEALRRLRTTLNQALGAAAGTREAAESAKRRLEFERRVHGVGFVAAARDQDIAELRADPELAEVWARLAAERADSYAEWRAAGLDPVRALVANETPGPSGRPWSEWLGRVGTDPGVSSPRLWRVGTARVEEADPGDEFPLAVPLLDHANLRLNSVPESRPAVESIVETLLLRLLSTFTPGLLRVHLWDIGHLINPLPNLQAFSDNGLMAVHDATRLDSLLAALALHIRKVHAKLRREGVATLREGSRLAGHRLEPWRVAVLFGNGERLDDELWRELNRVARTGPEAGVHLILVDMPVSASGPMETITFTGAETATASVTGVGIEVRPDPPLPAARVSRAAGMVGTEAKAMRGRERSFTDLLPARLGTGSSRDELRTVIGFDEGDPIDLVLGDATPHALVAGPSGSGKTNFLYALLGGLAARYPPSELELYLLDFKEGVSFAGLTPGRKDESWLPQARLVGVNVNTDREFGLALLRFLARELARRAEAAKRQEVTKLAELREAEPDVPWPRIVAVIDEFQALFNARDQITQQAASLLEDVARRGRSQGIHLVLASQDIAGIEAFWGKPAVYDQCTLRIAMPKAKRVLTDNNFAPLDLPRWHAVVNHESGVPHGNEIAHVPDASSRGTFDVLQRELYERLRPTVQPRLFDGGRRPELAGAAAYRAGQGPLLGQVIAVADSAATFRVAPVPGRNLAVLGTAQEDALSVMDSAALSLGRLVRPGEVEFSLWCPVQTLEPHVKTVADALTRIGHRVDTEFTAEKVQLTEGPRFVFFYAVDAAGLDSAGVDRLRALLKHGPAQHVHTFGWWRGVSRLKETLGFGGADDVGAWVALDVQGAELNTLSAGQLVDWSPRPHRAIHFDRSTHSRPDVLIPFDTASALEDR